MMLKSASVRGLVVACAILILAATPLKGSSILRGRVGDRRLRAGHRVLGLLAARVRAAGLRGHACTRKAIVLMS